MQLHVSVMFNMHKKWSGSVVYTAMETRENVTKPEQFNMFLPRFRLQILAILSCDNKKAISTKEKYCLISHYTLGAIAQKLLRNV